ncbi:unnamed protein product [Paramecium pentaurelia]|uniref:Uncharacterized protein n=1 Tax=Paramecium pentaurelia TaxID=43138 RepID=A0A8S1YML3_9CILI|nr:unnamed protein product [Paramecium pentaurelia]
MSFYMKGKQYCQFMDQLNQAKVLQPKKFKSLFGNYMIAIKKLGIMYQYLFIFHYTLQKTVFQALEESLKQDDYGFDDLQLKECKEILQKKEFRFIFIMDSYNEMKLENIQKNLYINNKLKQNWSDPLVIFTTRIIMPTGLRLKIIRDLKQSSIFSLNRIKNKNINILRYLRFKVLKCQFMICMNALDFKKFEQRWERCIHHYRNLMNRVEI